MKTDSKKTLQLSDIVNMDMKVTIYNTPENREILLKEGFEERCGSCAYERPYITVLPFKKHFWQDAIHDKQGFKSRSL